MPLQNLSYNLPGEQMTAIWKQVVADYMENFEEVAHAVYSDGVMPGTSPLPAKQRLVNYLTATDRADYSKLFDDNYLLRLQNGLDSPPVSPYWLNQLSIRSSYDRNRRDFQKLLSGTVPPLQRGKQG